MGEWFGCKWQRCKEEKQIERACTGILLLLLLLLYSTARRLCCVTLRCSSQIDELEKQLDKFKHYYYRLNEQLRQVIVPRPAAICGPSSTRLLALHVTGLNALAKGLIVLPVMIHV